MGSFFGLFGSSCVKQIQKNSGGCKKNAVGFEVFLRLTNLFGRKSQYKRPQLSKWNHCVLILWLVYCRQFANATMKVVTFTNRYFRSNNSRNGLHYLLIQVSKFLNDCMNTLEIYWKSQYASVKLNISVIENDPAWQHT